MKRSIKRKYFFIGIPILNSVDDFLRLIKPNAIMRLYNSVILIINGISNLICYSEYVLTALLTILCIVLFLFAKI